jgi:hypothetical protein
VTIYCPLDDLPLARLKGIAEGAQFFVERTDGKITAYRYVWPDFTIQINLLRGPELTSHLAGLVAYAESVAQNKGVALKKRVRDRICSTKLALGFVASFDRGDRRRFERLQNIMGAIAYNTVSIVFWEEIILDENAKPLI